jgi:thioredoxin 1
VALLTIVGSSGLAVKSSAEQSNPPIWAVKGEVLVTNSLDIDFSKYLVTFIELGADRCIRCRARQPIMKDIAKTFADRVQVVFYDVWKDPEPARKYKIQLIPTQVFVDQKGKDIPPRRARSQVSTPCAVPILAVLLAFVAEKGNVLHGGFLLFVYALGHSALVLVAGTSVGAAKALIESKGLRAAHGVLQKFAGVLIIGIGLYFVFGR